ncbi:pentapeptide repeat-containing protein [Microbispora sp. CA-135349]|uniref:pentapeptide repeat-containing protein n=1 Tax=Microbispora sp. CA-135349 TaxID=3239953 RepID=UPI003D938DE5
MDASRPPIKPLSWRLVAAGAVLVVALTSLVMLWLLHEAGRDPARRIDAIRTGFTVGLGGGGTLVLLLGARRQWLLERAQQHAEEDATFAREHQRQVAEDNRHDADERRITELYVKAVEQVGSSQALVRLGGLYALERLAQANAHLRQTITNVICAYLRMPYRPPARVVHAEFAMAGPFGDATTLTAPDEVADSVQELHARLAAQKILISHLRDDRPHDEREGMPDRSDFWQVSLDLEGACLVTFVAADCRFLDGTRFDGATFVGETRFNRARFCGRAGFTEAVFLSPVRFGAAVFMGELSFGSAVFHSTAWFDRATVADVNALHDAPHGWELRDTDSGRGTLVRRPPGGSPSG